MSDKLKIEPYIYSMEDRYIIVDEKGFDITGEHYTLQEAKKQIKQIKNETNK